MSPSCGSSAGVFQIDAPPRIAWSVPAGQVSLPTSPGPGRADQRQRIAPVLAFIANTSSLPVTTYMIPSLTSGVASAEYLPPNPEPLRRVIQAPLSCLTLLVSICFRVEYRWLVILPPFVTQSLPTGL